MDNKFFNRNFKKGLEIAGAAALSLAPNKTHDEGVLQQKLNPSAVHAEVTKSEKSKDDDTFYLNKEDLKQNKEGKKDFMEKERISNTIKVLRDDVIKQIPVDIKDHYESRYTKFTKIHSFDHEILALGNNKDFNTQDYLKLINKIGDSLYYEKDPKLPFEKFALDRGPWILISDKKREEEKLKAKIEFDSLTNTNDINEDFDAFWERKSQSQFWPNEEKTEKLKNQYDRYLENTRSDSLTREYHFGSTAYALLRSGVYDKFMQEGGQNAELVKKIINEINNSKYYSCDDSNPNNLVISLFGNYMLANEVEWMISTIIELEKRGVKTSFKIGGDVSNPLSLKDLNNINQKRLDFTLDTTMSRNEKYESKEVEKRAETLRTYEAACEGSHALHSLVMYDIYAKDHIKLKEHLELATNILAKKLKNIKDTLKKDNEVMSLVHDLSHELLPFTELSNDFNLDTHTKQIVQQAILKMIESVEYYKSKFGNITSVNDASHIIDVLEHLPDCVLKK